MGKIVALSDNRGDIAQLTLYETMSCTGAILVFFVAGKIGRENCVLCRHAL
jgi:hypothetical protein